MITLDELNEHMLVAGDAEMEGRLELAEQIRAQAWRDAGLREDEHNAPYGRAINQMFNMRALLIEMCVRGVVSRGYQLSDLWIERRDSYTTHETVASRNMCGPTAVLELYSGFCNPGPPGTTRELRYSVRWIGPRWPPWQIDPSDSEEWLLEVMRRAEQSSPYRGIMRSVVSK